MRKSLGDKRKELSAEQIAEITRLYGDFTDGDRVKILTNEAFGFLRITVERPLRLRWEITDETLVDRAGRQEADQAQPTVWTRWSAALDRTPRALRYRSEADRQDRRPDPAKRRAHRAAAEGGLGSARRPRPQAPPSSRTARASPNPTPTCVTTRTCPSPPCASRFEADPTGRFSTHRVPRRRRGLPRTRGPPLRPRRLDRPHQDQDRLRDPAHPPLLQVRAATAARRDRRRDQAARSRDPGLAARGDRVSWIRAARSKRLAGSQRPDVDGIARLISAVTVGLDRLVAARGSRCRLLERGRFDPRQSRADAGVTTLSAAGDVLSADVRLDLAQSPLCAGCYASTDRSPTAAVKSLTPAS